MPDDPKGLIPLQEFVKRVQSAKHADFANAPASLVKQSSAFEEMRGHILKLYEGATAAHSFVDENGSIFDCVPIAQQPSLKGVSGALPKAPDAPHIEAATGGTANDYKPAALPPQLGPDKKDKHGNVMQCPAGTIPLRRVTLDDMSRFENLHNFFHKTPGGGAIPPRADTSPQTGAGTAVAATHRWAHAFQNVNNLGGHNFINVWDPAIGANQVFSLAQHWYVGGSGSGLQTAEVGWQVYPQFYGGTKPVFFIYWTADGYNQTGCYNLSCSAFVQTNSSWAIGGTLSPWSTIGGQQYEIQVTFYLSGGRWWLYIGGTAAANAIGYYPVSIYKNGAMASHASEIDYGGETVGTTSFPPMGSGQFANQGWQKAAYQRQIYYFPQAGGSAWASLTQSQAWPKCYTTQLNNYASPWNVTLWFGGPGGSC